MSRGLRWGLGVAALLALAAASPLLLRQVPFFAVRRVEIVGAQYLAGEQLVTALHLAPDQNLFDPLGAAEESVTAVPGVERAWVSRRLPGTLRVTVVEREPVGLVSTDTGMVPLDCDGQPLPYDPARAGVALPILEQADSILTRALCVVRASDSTLFDAVQTVRLGRGQDVVLDLQDQRVWLRSAPTTTDIGAVAAVRRHLASTGRSFAELDARYQGRVYARGRRS
jgi:cell division septal protein FtsQ